MRIITGGKGKKPAPSAQNPDYNEKRRDNEFREKLSRHQVRRNIRIVLFLLVIVALLGYWLVYKRSRPYVGVSEVWAADITTAASQRYCQFSDGILQYGNRGAVFYNSSQGATWSASYEMKNPAVCTSDTYCLIYDQGDRTAVVLSATGGLTGTIETELPITKGTVSSHGVAALLVEKELSNNLVFYDRDGNKLEITVKTLMSESGYPMDMSFSPDGQTMIASFVYVDNGVLQDRIVFYSFDTSKNTSTHVVASFQKYSDTLFPDVEFLSQDVAAAFGDGRIVIFSTLNRVAPEEKAVIEPDGIIKNLAYDSKHIAFVTEDTAFEQNQKLYLYDAGGVLLYEKDTDFEAEKLCLGAGGVYLYGTSTLQYFDLKGRQLYRGSVDNTVLELKALSKGTEFLVITNQKFLKLKLIK